MAQRWCDNCGQRVVPQYRSAKGRTCFSWFTAIVMGTLAYGAQQEGRQQTALILAGCAAFALVIAPALNSAATAATAHCPICKSSRSLRRSAPS